MTEVQTLLELNPSRRPKDLKGQAARLRDFFLERPDQWIPLPAIMELHIAQYNARIWDLRGVGMVLENRTEVVNGARHSFFRYIRGNDGAQTHD